MLFFVEITIFAIVLAWWWYRNDQKIHQYCAPGPFRFPVFGNIIQVLVLLRTRAQNFPARAFQLLAEEHGDVMHLKMGGNDVVVFSSGEAIREILNHDKANGRAQLEFIKDRHNKKNLGLIWGYDKPWLHLRRFTMRHLRDFGYGKSAVLNELLNDEFAKFCAHLNQQVKEASDGIIYVEDMFALTVVAVLWRLVSGKSYEYNDPKMVRLLQLNSDFFKSTNMGFDITDSFPFLRDVFPHWSGRALQRKTSKALYDYGKELLDDHSNEMSGDQNDDERAQSFIEVFARKVAESKEDPETPFTDEQFVLSILDLLIAGSETSSNTLSFGLLYMLLHPDIQEKVQNEIDREVPDQNVLLDIGMKSRLPYTTATVLEIFRFSTIAPTPAPRAASEDFYFRDYFIKKNSCLIYNVYAVHYSKSIWKDPETFRPERFLIPEETKIDLNMADKLEVWGSGKRFCIGQQLAEPTIFLFFASTMRKFKFVKVPGTNPSMEPVLGVTTSPQPFYVKVIDRNACTDGI